MLRIFRIETQLTGNIPSNGLLVCNHLSYLDILILGSLTPCVFVAKREVRHWPVLGWFATLAGTVFVHREKRTRAARSVAEIGAALRTGALVVLFPEGTSSGGATVLPFKSSLLESAAQQSHPLTAGLLAYELADGDASEEVCYWKDMTLVPHLINLCSKRTVHAAVHFNHLGEGHADRKQLARQLHAEVLRMKSAVAITQKYPTRPAAPGFSDQFGTVPRADRRPLPRRLRQGRCITCPDRRHAINGAISDHQ
jgi:1-acyl-sn-glycerol-3-phosphate acyltransferase